MPIDSNDYLTPNSASDQSTAMQNMLDAWGASSDGVLVWRAGTYKYSHATLSLDTRNSFVAGRRYSLSCDGVILNFSANTPTTGVHFYLGGDVSYTAISVTDDIAPGQTHFWADSTSWSGYNAAIITTGPTAVANVNDNGPWYQPSLAPIAYYRGELQPVSSVQNTIVKLEGPAFQEYTRFYTSAWRAKLVRLDISGTLTIQANSSLSTIGVYLHCLSDSAISGISVTGTRTIGIEGFHLLRCSLSDCHVADGWRDGESYGMHLHSCRDCVVEDCTFVQCHHGFTLGGWHFNRGIRLRNIYAEQDPQETVTESTALRLHENAAHVLMENVTAVGGCEIPSVGVTANNCTFTSTSDHQKDAMGIHPRMSNGSFIFNNCTFVNPGTHYNSVFCVTESERVTINEISFNGCTFTGGNFGLNIAASSAATGPYYIKKLAFINPTFTNIASYKLQIQGTTTTITIDELVDRNGAVFPATPSTYYFDGSVTINSRR